MLIFDAGELKFEISIPAPSIASVPTTSPLAISTITQYSKGFFCGTSTSGVIVYEKLEDSYTLIKEFKVQEEPFSRVMNIAISPTEDDIVCSLENSQLYSLTISSAEMIKVIYCTVV